MVWEKRQHVPLFWSPEGIVMMGLDQMLVIVINLYIIKKLYTILYIDSGYMLFILRSFGRPNKVVGTSVEQDYVPKSRSAYCHQPLNVGSPLRN